MPPRDRDNTNPGFPSLDDIPVSEAQCQKRTKVIENLQRDTLSAIDQVSKKIETHQAWHNGKSMAVSGMWTKMGAGTKILVALFGLIAAIVGTAITVGQVNKADNREIAEHTAKAVYHMLSTEDEDRLEDIDP